MVSGDVPGGGSDAGSPRRMLVADDNRDLCDLMCLMAEDAGFVAHGVYNGADFRRAFDDLHPDYVLLDLVMPDEDGLELMRFMSTRGVTPRLIVASSQPDAILRSVKPLAEGLGLDLAAVLVKPFTVGEFRAVL